MHKNDRQAGADPARAFLSAPVPDLAALPLWAMDLGGTDNCLIVGLRPLDVLTDFDNASAVIDWDAFGVGDPALQLMSARTMVDGPERWAFFAAGSRPDGYTGAGAQVLQVGYDGS